MCEKIIPITDLPQSSIGAPMPMLFSNELDLFIAYYLENTPKDWDGTTVKVMTADAEKEPISILKFPSFLVYQFGPPNDEAFHGHPLYKKGLRPYSVYEIDNSRWIAYFERMNAVHPQHNKERFKKYRHFILGFHDTTLEVIAEKYEYKRMVGSLKEAVGFINPQLLQ